MKNSLKYILISTIACLAIQTGCSDDNDVNDQTSCDTKNVCGGCKPLPLNVGSACGICGKYACDGEDAVKCVDPGKNACNVCGELEHTPGEACSNGGTWGCKADGTLECQASSGTQKNACGGTIELGYYGEKCGSCGTYVCDGEESLKCDDHAKNVCGGCDILEHAPGDACEGGIWSCETNGSLSCKAVADSGEKNACGGTAVIGEPGGACGECGKYECAGTDAFKCNDPGRNACGGCGDIKGFAETGKTVGDSCGVCGSYSCTSQNSVECSDPGKNGCGGCNPLIAQPNTKCGDGACALWTCVGENSIACGTDSINACGGCDALAHQPGEKCESSLGCCTWECDGNGGIKKDEHAPNACGGCGTLEAELNSPCQNKGGTWKCDTTDANKNSLSCECSVKNVCGGCDPDPEKKIGSFCEICDYDMEIYAGKYICGDKDYRCVTEAQTIDKPYKNHTFYFSDSASDSTGYDEYNFDGILSYEGDAQYFKFAVTDEKSGILEPRFSTGVSKSELCVYIHENRDPSSVNYKNEGKLKNASGGYTYVTPYREDTLVVNGVTYHGFCTTGTLPDDHFKLIMITGFEGLFANNSFTGYITLKPTGNEKFSCRPYSVYVSF